MQKLSLKLEDLTVASFETGSARGPRGTIHAHNHTRGGHWTCGNTCGGQNTCDCPVTVEVTCLEPCGTTLCGPTTADTSLECCVEG